MFIYIFAFWLVAMHLFALVVVCAGVWKSGLLDICIYKVETLLRTLLARYEGAVGRAKVRMKVSRRARALLKLADTKMLSAIEDLQFAPKLPLAWYYSRLVRQALHFPKHSPANEIIVSDWIQRNWKEGMRTQDKVDVLPWAIKLAFVRSKEEIQSDMVLELLQGSIDVA